MALERGSGQMGGKVANFADAHFTYCPFCGVKHPEWLSEGYQVKFAWQPQNQIWGYKFQCPKCQGMFEVHSNTPKTFFEGLYLETKLTHPGTGKYNHEYVGKEITFAKLEQLCSTGVQEAPSKVCANCGTELTERMIFCKKCGTKYEAPAPKVIETPVTPVINQPVAQENASEMKFCTGCGSKISVHAAFCTSCGKAQNVSPANVKYCIGCGKPLKDGEVFCTNCGKQN